MFVVRLALGPQSRASVGKPIVLLVAKYRASGPLYGHCQVGLLTVAICALAIVD